MFICFQPTRPNHRNYTAIFCRRTGSQFTFVRPLCVKMALICKNYRIRVRVRVRIRIRVSVSSLYRQLRATFLQIRAKLLQIRANYR